MDLLTPTSKIEERLVISATQRNIPLGGAFELLPLCNMNCRMCFLRLSPSEMQTRGRLRTVEEWIALAEQARDAGLLFLLLTGGEILLYPDFERLYLELYRMGFYLTINTNGTLIDEKIADLWAAHLPRRVNITLYGASDATYGKLCGNPSGFTQTMSGIRLLLERQIPVKLNGSLTAYNKDELPALQAIARDLQVPIEIDSYMFPSARKGILPFDHASRLSAEEAAKASLSIRKEEMDEEAFARWLAVLDHFHEMAAPADPADNTSGHLGEEITCRAGKSSFWITWEGEMTPCVFMENPAMPVFETGFANAWKKINKSRQGMFFPAACTKCDRRDVCTVCSACALTETGDPLRRPAYMCAMTNEKLRLAHEWRAASRQATASSEMSQPNS